jgi:PKD repeat protein
MAARYGSGAYPYKSSDDPAGLARTGHNVGGPVGGGVGYRHYYNPDDYGSNAHLVASQSQLISALSAATSGHLIWVTASFGVSGQVGSIKPGVVLASFRGRGGVEGPTITYLNHISGLFQVGANVRVSGLRIKGDNPRGNSSSAFQCGGNSGQEFENVWLHDVGYGLIRWTSNAAAWNGSLWNSSTPYIHHCDLYGALFNGGQDSYGVQVAPNGAGGYFIQATNMDYCRHVTMTMSGTSSPNQYEVSYSNIGTCYGWNGGNQHQIDWHGCGSTGYCPSGDWPGYRYAADFTRILYNTFTANGNARNCVMRGLVKTRAEVRGNWTLKTEHSGVWPAGGAYQSSNSGIYGMTGEENSADSGYGSLTSANSYVYDNWWGTTPPPTGPDDPGDPTVYPPKANFTSNVTSGTVPLTVNFTDTSLDVPTVWLWNFGDGVVSTSQNISHTYSVAGTYTVALSCQNSAGLDTETKTAYIRALGGTELKADFSGNPLEGSAPLSVLFSNLSQNADTYAWTFGDGGASTDAEVSHTYSQAGVYDVSLLASASTAAATLDVGAAASDRASASATGGYTDISLTNPLNATGTLDTVEVFMEVAATGLKVGTFYGTAPNFTCRSMVEIGNAAAGVKETFTTDASANPITLTGAAGDYVGYHMDTGSMSYDATGGGGLYYASGDLCNVGNSGTYTLLADRNYSIYASGTDAGSVESDTETKTSYITVTGVAASTSLKLKVVLTPKNKLSTPGAQVAHMLANSKGGI